MQRKVRNFVSLFYSERKVFYAVRIFFVHNSESIDRIPQKYGNEYCRPGMHIYGLQLQILTRLNRHDILFKGSARKIHRKERAASSAFTDHIWINTVY